MGNKMCGSGKGDGGFRVLMIGLDSAGKTTLLYQLKLGEVVTTIPTIGFNVESVSLKSKNKDNLTIWDIGGQDKIRSLWRHYFQNTQGIAYVLDSTDRERFSESRDELMRVLDNEELRGVPLVVIANKQDMPNAASEGEVIEQLRLDKIEGRMWHVEATCATSGDGVYKAMKEMRDLIKHKR